MAMPEVLAVAWNNGSYHQTGAGYGLKLAAADRVAHMRRAWGRIFLFLTGRREPALVNIDKDMLARHDL